MLLQDEQGGAEGIEAARAKIDSVDAALKQAAEAKTQTEADLKEHQTNREEAKETMSQATAMREKEAKTFAKEKAELDTNLGALGKAISAIDKGMSGAFVQTPTASIIRKFAMERAEMPDGTREELLSFLSGTQGTGYAPASGEITGILKTMEEDMQKDLADATATENSAVENYKALMAAKTKEVETLSAQIEQEMMRVGEMGVQIAGMSNDLEDTKAALDADTKFQLELEGSCSTKTAEWEEIKKTRAEELAGLGRRRPCRARGPTLGTNSLRGLHSRDGQNMSAVFGEREGVIVAVIVAVLCVLLCILGRLYHVGAQRRLRREAVELDARLRDTFGGRVGGRDYHRGGGSGGGGSAATARRRFEHDLEQRIERLEDMLGQVLARLDNVISVPAKAPPRAAQAGRGRQDASEAAKARAEAEANVREYDAKRQQPLGQAVQSFYTTSRVRKEEKQDSSAEFTLYQDAWADAIHTMESAADAIEAKRKTGSKDPVKVTALVGTTEDKAVWEDMREASGGQLHATLVRVLRKGEEPEQGEFTRYVTGRVRAAGKAGPTVARQVAFVKLGDAQGPKKEEPTTVVFTRSAETVVVRCTTDDRFVEEGSWKTVLHNPGKNLREWVGECVESSERKLVGDSWGWVSEAGIGGGKPLVQGLLRVRTQVFARVLAASGSLRETRHGGVRWFVEPLRWEDTALGRCNVVWMKKDSEATWDQHMRALETQANERGLALGVRDVGVRLKRAENDDTSRRQWRLQGFPPDLDAEEVAKVLVDHAGLKDVEPRSKLRGGIWIVSAVASRDRTVVDLRIQHNDKVWNVVGWHHGPQRGAGARVTTDLPQEISRQFAAERGIDAAERGHDAAETVKKTETGDAMETDPAEQGKEKDEQHPKPAASDEPASKVSKKASYPGSLELVAVAGNGDCLANAFSEYTKDHCRRKLTPLQVRVAAVAHMRKNVAVFSKYWDGRDPKDAIMAKVGTEGFLEYLKLVKVGSTVDTPGAWMGALEVFAISESFGVPIAVWIDGGTVECYGKQHASDSKPWCHLYFAKQHYNYLRGKVTDAALEHAVKRPAGARAGMRGGVRTADSSNEDDVVTHLSFRTPKSQPTAGGARSSRTCARRGATSTALSNADGREEDDGEEDGTKGVLPTCCVGAQSARDKRAPRPAWTAAAQGEKPERPVSYASRGDIGKMTSWQCHLCGYRYEGKGDVAKMKYQHVVRKHKGRESEFRCQKAVVELERVPDGEDQHFGWVCPVRGCRMGTRMAPFNCRPVKAAINRHSKRAHRGRVLLSAPRKPGGWRRAAWETKLVTKQNDQILGFERVAAHSDHELHMVMVPRFGKGVTKASSVQLRSAWYYCTRCRKMGKFSKGVAMNTALLKAKCDTPVTHYRTMDGVVKQMRVALKRKWSTVDRDALQLVRDTAARLRVEEEARKQSWPWSRGRSNARSATAAAFRKGKYDDYVAQARWTDSAAAHRRRLRAVTERC